MANDSAQFAQLQVQFEQAAEVVEKGTDRAQRQNAEGVFMELLSKRQPYQLCFFLMENSKSDYVVWTAIKAIPKACLREWSSVDMTPDALGTMFDQLLNYAMGKPDLRPFVLKEIVHSTAILLKRAWLEPERQQALEPVLWAHVERSLTQESPQQQHVAASQLQALLTEFGSSSSSSGIGLSYEFHHRCKQDFETNGLKRTFVLTLQVLQSATAQVQNGTDDIPLPSEIILKDMLTVASNVLSWPFGRVGHMTESFDAGESLPILRPAKHWAELLVGHGYPPLQVMFTLYPRICSRQQLAHSLSQCLQQLATLSGPILPTLEARVNYLSFYLQGFIAIMKCQNNKTPEEMKLAHSVIINRLTSSFNQQTWSTVNPSLFQEFLQLSAGFTLDCLNARLGDDEFSPWNSDSIDQLFTAWTSLMLNGIVDSNTAGQAAQEIFNTYVKTALQDGRRKAEQEADDEEDEDFDDDKDVYDDILTSTAVIGRHAIAPSMQTVSGAITHTIGQLQHTMTALMQGQQGDMLLWEDLHWLLLIAGHLIADSDTGEIPEIPECFTQGWRGSAEASQAVCTMMQGVLQFCQGCMQILQQHGDNGAVSPYAMQTVLWFLHRWARTYLFTNKQTADPAILQAFGLQSEHSGQILVFLVQFVQACCSSMSAEKRVCSEACSLLLALVKMKTCRIALMTQLSPQWLEFVTIVKQRQSPMSNMGPDHLVSLYTALSVASWDADESNEEMQYLIQLVESLVAPLKKVAADFDSFRKSAQNVMVETELRRVLSGLTGCFHSIVSNNQKQMLQLVWDPMMIMPQIMECYTTNAQVQGVILECWAVFLEHMGPYATNEQEKHFADAVLHMVRRFHSDFIKGNRSRKRVDEVEDIGDGIRAMLQMNLALFSKDYVDFSDEVSGTQDLHTMVAVVQCLPLLANAALELEDLSKTAATFYTLLQQLFEVHVEHILQLEGDPAQAIVLSLDKGLNSPSAIEVCRRSFESIATLYEGVFNDMQKHGANFSNVHANKIIPNSAGHFLKNIMELLLFKPFNMDLIGNASKALFATMCCCQNDFMRLAHEVVQNVNETFQGDRDRVAKAFDSMMNGGQIELNFKRRNMENFRAALQVFLGEVRGILMFK
eukprot:Clim_evm108s210 gene=Clim_evmTU108s210